jgi:RNA polymerase sigma-70 factor (ECF subfamily)
MDFHKLPDTELYLYLADKQSPMAFAELYNRYSRKILLYCQKIMIHQQDAEDAFQETWIQFHNAGKNAVQVQNISGYLFRIARNCCLMKKRNSSPPVMEYMDIHANKQENSYEYTELNQMLEKALDLLDHEYREAFVLHELEGFSYEEIAQITGSSIDALRNKVWRARKHIKTWLAPFTS